LRVKRQRYGCWSSRYRSTDARPAIAWNYQSIFVLLYHQIKVWCTNHASNDV